MSSAGSSGRFIGELENGSMIGGHYEVRARLGRGSFGATYLAADHHRFGARCVVKLLRPRNDIPMDLAKRYFEREARALARIRHERVPELCAYFEADDQFVLVQSYVPGTNLIRLLGRHRRLEESEVRQICADVLQILMYLHSLTPPAVHRDVKPDNLVRDQEGRIHLVDFGGVRDIVTEAGSEMASVFFGSQGYAAPEQKEGHAIPASDLYSLGATALRLLVPVDQKVTRDMLGNIGLTASFAGWLARMLAPVETRFASAAEALDALLADPACDPLQLGVDAAEIGSRQAETPPGRSSAGRRRPRLSTTRAALLVRSPPTGTTPRPKPKRRVPGRRLLGWIAAHALPLAVGLAVIVGVSSAAVYWFRGETTTDGVMTTDSAATPAHAPLEPAPATPSAVTEVFVRDALARQYRFVPTTGIFSARLAKGASQAFPVTLDTEHAYMLMGACDPRCTDLNLSLNWRDGWPVKADSSKGPLPGFEHRPRRSGAYVIVLRMAECPPRTVCLAQARVYDKPRD
jgi:tRNA A-37 threonylcarbamoyl transferase component Bud32